MKRTAFALIATFVPFAAAQVDPARVFAGPVRTAERAVVGLAEAMPEELYSFAPSAEIFAGGRRTEFKGVRTFAQQVAHIASSNYEYLQVIGLASDKNPATIEKLTSKTEVLKELKESFSMAEKAASTTTAQNAFEGLGARKTSTRAGLLASIAWHSMDHYGQIVEYARMNGIVPPESRK